MSDISNKSVEGLFGQEKGGNEGGNVKPLRRHMRFWSTDFLSEILDHTDSKLLEVAILVYKPLLWFTYIT